MERSGRERERWLKRSDKGGREKRRVRVRDRRKHT